MATSGPGWKLVPGAIGAIAIIVAACSGAAPSPSPVATSTPIVTPVPTVAPTEAPTSTPDPTPTCTVSLDRTPTPDEFFYLSGSGFEPGIDIELTFVDLGVVSVWGGPNGEVKPKLLHTTSEGDFGPYDIMYTDVTITGEYSITASDGSCEATVNYTIEAPAPS